MQTRAVNDNANRDCRHALIPVFEVMICSALNSGFSHSQVAAALVELARQNFRDVHGVEAD
jgi:hypothetical protein